MKPQAAISKLIYKTGNFGVIVSLNMRKAPLLCLGMIALTGCTVFGQSFTCDDEPSTREDGGNQIVTCYSPDFLITCDSKTVTIVDDVLRCTSADGKEYKITNRKAQDNKRCARKLGEYGIYNAEKKECECDYPYFLKNGRCENLMEVCEAKYGSAGVVKVDGSCNCTSGYVLKDEQCISVDGICKEQFGEGAQRAELDDTKCQCGTGYKWNEAGDKCVCADNYHLENGACVENPFCGWDGWGKYDPVKDTCVCNEGYVLNNNGVCVAEPKADCGYAGTYNKKTKACDCNHGYYLKNDKCLSIPLCGSGEFDIQQEECVCDEGARLRNGFCFTEL